jgi:hypothetical protein
METNLRYDQKHTFARGWDSDLACVHRRGRSPRRRFMSAEAT